MNQAVNILNGHKATVKSGQFSYPLCSERVETTMTPCCKNVCRIQFRSHKASGPKIITEAEHIVCWQGWSEEGVREQGVRAKQGVRGKQVESGVAAYQAISAGLG